MWKVQLAFSRTSQDVVLGNSEEPVIYPARGNTHSKNNDDDDDDDDVPWTIIWQRREA